MPPDSPPSTGSTPPVSATPPPSVTPPLISIIIACKDPGMLLREALASVWAQLGLQIEIIVIDGGSEDGSRVWLASQRTRLTTLIMENDQGVYEAMNKGVAAARGEWIYFLGADDKFYHDAVLSRAQSVLKQNTEGVVVGEIAYTDGRIYQLPAKPDPVARNFVHHQGAFYRRALFAQHGNFDATLQIMADYDYNLKLRKAGVKFTSLPQRIAICGTNGLSDSGSWRGYQEEITVRHRYFPAWRCWLADLGSVVRFLRKKTVKRPKPH